MEIDTIINWFKENSELTQTEITQNLEKNYLLLGWIEWGHLDPSRTNAQFWFPNSRQ